jgi:hypothetical protein
MSFFFWFTDTDAVLCFLHSWSISMNIARPRFTSRALLQAILLAGHCSFVYRSLVVGTAVGR